jgi:glycosyltransferase involved in cell wall biosynthesis
MGRPDHSAYERIDGVHYHRCPFSAHSNPVEEINNMCRAFANAVFDTENYIGGSFDIVHAHDWLTVNAMAWIKYGRGRKSILTMHSTEYGRCGNNFYGGTSQAIRDIEWLGMYEAHRVIAVSRALKKEVGWIYQAPEEKVTVVYNGVPFWHFNGFIDPVSVRSQHGIGQSDPFALFVGRMTSQKGPDLLIEAIAKVLAHHPAAKFILAGEGHLRGQVESRAQQLGIGTAIRFYGYLDRGQVIDLYKACDCVVVPSRNEPFGIVVLEGWSAGKPIVATNTGGPAELIWDGVTGYIVEQNPEAISGGIGAVFADLPLSRQMGKNGRIAVETAFSWDIIADHVLAVYNS